MKNLQFVGICGSLRRNSRNMGLLRKALKIMPEGSSLIIADIAPIPFYSEDIEKPDSVKALIELANDSDGFLFACPEYNFSLAPALKNAIDWLSREPGQRPLSGKTGAMAGAGGRMGTCRSQLALRTVCSSLNVHLIDKPEFYANAFSPSFDANGDLIDPDLEKLLGKLLASLCEWTRYLQKE